jgi:hypothetical protein
MVQQVESMRFAVVVDNLLETARDVSVLEQFWQGGATLGDAEKYFGWEVVHSGGNEFALF